MPDLASEKSRPPRSNPIQRLLKWLKSEAHDFSFPRFVLAAKYPQLSSKLTLEVLSLRSVFLAMFQATPVAREFGAQTYVIAIVASLCFPMNTRAKFIQTMVSNTLFSGLAACISLLGLWCAREAKIHTQSPGESDRYNSSAAAVSAVFLFFNLFSVNAFRAVRLSRGVG